ncbi:hypothetical protein CEQ90_09135 [Lewinellaceae bacterium SD302]|nr:hypothetical protein CEQ90_09135 [Lewinellaceae bacterium SD302]
MPLIAIIFALLFSTSLSAQYFQQRVDYRITAELDDRTHFLHANLEVDYTNNAPEALTEIYFHLWPRAFSSDNTAFARQQLRDGETRFHFSKNSERGTLDSLDFKLVRPGRDGVAEQSLEWSYPDPGNPDIALLQLHDPLPSGAKVTITTPFRVKIPASFSRLGHVGQSYQMTQWYPKPAVYDQDGWHPMPYLDRGEFYSEFGSFDVSITLPQNYRVGATGVLQNEAETNWLLNLAAATEQEMDSRSDLSEYAVDESFPPSANAKKTLRYLAEDVHDFAWFADKRFKVLHDQAYGSNGQELHLWAFFNETEAAYWKKSIRFLEWAIEFYSEKIGMYPYPQVTAVQSALSAGAGMEYPMITVIGRSYGEPWLNEVIAHEVGHNWFYGILATNERTHPWMDEGFNSFYERLYMQRRYEEPQDKYSILGQSVNIGQLGYRYQTLLGAGQSPDMDSDSMAENNYWLNAYSKPDLALQYLVLQYGQDSVDQAMQRYYESWKFRHPGPDDVKAVFEDYFKADLSWLFDDFLRSNNTVDYYIDRVKGSYALKRKGDIDAPAELETDFTNSADGRVVLTGPLDLNDRNNFLSRPLDFSLLIEPQDKFGSRHLFYLPLLGANAQDGLMAGAALHNRTLEPKIVEFLVAPAYGFKSNKPAGFAGLQWRLPEGLRPGFANTGKLSLGYQRFSNFEFRDEAYQYQRLAGKWSYDFATSPIRQLKSSVSAQVVNIWQNRPDFNEEGDLAGTQTRGSTFTRLLYERSKTDIINPRSLTLNLEYGTPGAVLTDDYLKAEIEWTGGYQYQQDRFIRWRLFGGYFLANELRESNFTPNYAFSLVGNAASDYAFDNIYLGRRDDRSYGQQVSSRMGGFRVPIDRALGIGVSNNYMVALNLDARLPIGPTAFPLGIFVDAASYGRSPIRADGEEAFQWVGGLSLNFLDGQVGIYAPLVGSDLLDNSLDQRGGFIKSIGFKLSMTSFLPWELIDDIKL